MRTRSTSRSATGTTRGGTPNGWTAVETERTPPHAARVPVVPARVPGRPPAARHADAVGRRILEMTGHSASDTGPLDTIVFQSPTVTIGAFRCPPSHPRFHDSGPIQNDIFVFPRRAV